MVIDILWKINVILYVNECKYMLLIPWRHNHSLPHSQQCMKLHMPTLQSSWDCYIGGSISQTPSHTTYSLVQTGHKIYVLHLDWKYIVNSIKEYCIVEWWWKLGALSKLYWFMGQRGFVGSPVARLEVVWCNFLIT